MREKPSWTLLFVFWPQFSIFVLQKKPRPDKKFLIFWLSPGCSSVILISGPSPVIPSSAPSHVILSSGGAKNLSPGPKHGSFAALRMTNAKKPDGCK